MLFKIILQNITFLQSTECRIFILKLKIRYTHPVGHQWRPRQDTLCVIGFRCCRSDRGNTHGKNEPFHSIIPHCLKTKVYCQPTANSQVSYIFWRESACAGVGGPEMCPARPHNQSEHRSSTAEEGEGMTEGFPGTWLPLLDGAQNGGWPCISSTSTCVHMLSHYLSLRIKPTCQDLSHRSHPPVCPVKDEPPEIQNRIHRCFLAQTLCVTGFWVSPSKHHPNLPAHNLGHRTSNISCKRFVLSSVQMIS